VGGPWGYGEFLAAIADPDHAEHDEFLDWVGGDFDPEAFKVSEVDEAFDLMGWVPLRATAPATVTTSSASAKSAG
jgi:hypothetical protein